MDFPFQKSLQFREFRLDLQSNEAKILDILKDQFVSSEADSGFPVKKQFTFSIELLRGSGGAEPQPNGLQYSYDRDRDVLQLEYLSGSIRVEVQYAEDSVRACVTADALAHAAALGNWILTIPLAQLLKKSGLYFMHAACLEKDGRGYLFAGKSGSGKTTLTLGLLQQGWNAISDDDVFLTERDGQLMALGGPDRCKVTAETWRWLEGEKETDFAGKRELSLERRFPGQLRRETPVDYLFFLAPENRTAIQKLQAVTAFERLLRLAFLPGNPKLVRQNWQFLGMLSNRLEAGDLRFRLDFADLEQKIQKCIQSEW